MDKELRDKWTTALRSGDYKQTTGGLREKGVGGDEFCCLGVLCDITGQVWVSKPSIGEGAQAIVRGDETYSGYLPSELARELGLADQYEWSGMNDDGKTFEQIANAIEAKGDDL